MRIDDVIYFSPGLRAVDLDFDDKEQILNCFSERIREYYLVPCRLLNEYGKAFAAGTILMAAIDAITYYTIGGRNRIKDFIYETSLQLIEGKDNLKRISKIFDDYFRNGLIHEGRIKCGGQFSYCYSWLATFENDLLIINPSILLDEVEQYFKAYLEKVTSEAHYELFIEKFKRQYKHEVDFIKSKYS